MNNLEDALRGAFDSDLGSPVDRLISDVRRGAHQRRARRTTAVAAGAVAAVVAVIGIGGAALLGGEQDSPDPAPPAPKGPVPGRFAMAAEEVGDVVWVTARERDCGKCAVLWRHDADGWERVHDFPTEYVDRLAFTPDGTDGLTADGGSIWSTHDGGETWSRAQVPDDDDPEGRSFVLAASDDWLRALDLIGGALWQAPVGTDDWQASGGPGVGPITDLFTAGDRLVVVNGPRGEGSTESFPAYSLDDGESWGDLPFPCSGENKLHPTDGAIFVLCPDGAVVYRSTKAGRWEQFGTSTGYLSDTVPLAEDRVLLRGRHEVLLTATGPVGVDTGLGKDASVWDSARTDGSTYLTTTEGVLVSTDDGLTWGPAE